METTDSVALSSANSSLPPSPPHSCSAMVDRLFVPWPSTPTSTYASVSCATAKQALMTHPQHTFPTILEYFKNDDANVSRFCRDNGTWSKANYYICSATVEELHDIRPTSINEMIYIIGNSVSLVACIFAFFLLAYFSNKRSLHCLRNRIHSNLILTFILKSIDYFLLLYIGERIVNVKEPVPSVGCSIILSLYHYIRMTNFCWMFVEGLHLYLVVVWAFTGAGRMKKFWLFLMIGWCLPAVPILAWIFAQIACGNHICFVALVNSSDIDPADEMYTVHSVYDYIYITPILLLLFVNLIFLLSIMWVLFTKLKSSNTLEIRQYRKAFKGIFFVLHLFGLTFILFITTSEDPNTKLAFSITNAILESLQGLCVSFFFCFNNNEVRAALMRKLTDWREMRYIGQHRDSEPSGTRNGGVDQGNTMSTLQSFGELSRGSIQSSAQPKSFTTRFSLLKTWDHRTSASSQHRTSTSSRGSLATGPSRRGSRDDNLKDEEEKFVPEGSGADAEL